MNNLFNDSDQNLIKEYVLKISGSFCPMCGFKKRPEDLKLLKVVDNVYNFISSCNTCGLKNLILFTPNLGFQMTHLRTDISVDEFYNFKTPVSNEDYLWFYNKMKNVKTAEDLLSLIKN